MSKSVLFADIEELPYSMEDLMSSPRDDEIEVEYARIESGSDEVESTSYSKTNKKSYSGLELKSMRFSPMNIYNKDFLPLANGVSTIVSGAGGVGKGFVVLQSAMRFLQENKDATAAVWFAEDGLRVVQERLALFDMDDDLLERIHFVNTSPKDVKGGWDKVLGMADFVVIDPLVYFYDGEENSNDEAAAFMRKLNEKCKAKDNIVIVVHHLSKEGKTRGASAFTDNARLVYELALSGDSKAPDKAVDVSIKKDNFHVCNKPIGYITPQRMDNATQESDFGDDL